MAILWLCSKSLCCLDLFGYSRFWDRYSSFEIGQVRRFKRFMKKSHSIFKAPYLIKLYLCKQYCLRQPKQSFAMQANFVIISLPLCEWSIIVVVYAPWDGTDVILYWTHVCIYVRIIICGTTLPSTDEHICTTRALEKLNFLFNTQLLLCRYHCLVHIDQTMHLLKKLLCTICFPIALFIIKTWASRGSHSLDYSSRLYTHAKLWRIGNNLSSMFLRCCPIK